MYGHCSQLALTSCSYLSQASHIFPVCGGKGGMGRENTLPFTFSLFLPLMGKIRLFVVPPLSLTPSDHCSLVRVKATAFKQFFEDNPDSLLRMVQVREGKRRWEGARHPSFSSLPPTSPLPSFFLRPSPSTLSLSPSLLQIIMLRLQRVTFLALNEFLGLGHELINQVS